MLFEVHWSNITGNMLITLNGKQKDLPTPMTLQALVAQSAKAPEHVVAELNGAIIEKARWGTTTVPKNAVIELVTFVGGG